MKTKKRKRSKRLDNAYKNYKKRYRAAKKKLNKRGYEMADTMLNKREYLMVREAYVDDEGLKININQTIVSEQTYEYSQKIAQQFKKVAEKYDLEWKDTTITQLRKGVNVDVSALNEKLKEEYPDWTGTDRQKYISYEVFGSD